MAAGSERLLSGLEMVSLKFGDVLYESESRIRYAYFPTTSIVSFFAAICRAIASRSAFGAYVPTRNRLN